MRDVLHERREAIRPTSGLGDWQAITIRFSGEVLPRDRSTPFKGAMFAAYPGDLVFSKIDARNGALGIVPDTMPQAVVTSEYPVLIPDQTRLRPAYLDRLLRAAHFRTELQRQASGTSGRKRVTADGFLGIEVPIPTLAEQDAFVGAYTADVGRAIALEREAQAIEDAGLRAFEEALGMVLLPAVPARSLFVCRFKDMDRWSHEAILRATLPAAASGGAGAPLARLGDLVADLENGWSPKCQDYPARQGRWGVLKVGAVSFGTYDDRQNKELPDRLRPRAAQEVKPGDVLIGRANVTRYVGACAYVAETRPALMLCDKIFRVRFRDASPLLPQFLAEAMRLRSVRDQIEARLTGTSPTMKNISKPALLDLRLPLPGLEVQRALVAEVECTRQDACAKRTEAATLRQSAWSAFEVALFGPAT